MPALQITLDRIADPAAVEADWRALEAVSEPSFFQTWTWVGCLARERFPDPLLLRAEQGGRLVALALLNRTRPAFGAERLWLHESGDAAFDAVYVEHNGPLIARDCPEALAPCAAALLAAGGAGAWRRIVRLAGVGAAVRDAAVAAGSVRLLRRSDAPCRDLSALAPGDQGLLARLSANTRQQIRRSDRAYAALGPPVVEEARTVADALAALDALARLHQASWQARGKPGAFANPQFLRFHCELLARAVPRGEVALLRIGFGPHVAGYLYNFRHGDTVSAYQSGFDFAGAPPHGKPGLTCHHAAMLRARDEGARLYDFLAGPDRYKTSLSDGARPLFWLDAAHRTSVPGLTLRLLSRVGR